MALQKKGLGRGLDALIPTAPAVEAHDQSKAVPSGHTVPVDQIKPSPFQPRRNFDDGKISELAASISEQGLIQPLVIRRLPTGFELIAGERRWRAAIKAGLTEVPVIIREATDTEALQLALVENLQREDLNPVEEAAGYQRLQQEFQWTQEEMADRIGKSRPAIANSLRLLTLPQEVQQELAGGNLPAGQARALLGLPNETLIVAACREVIRKGLSTRETEKLVRVMKLGRRRRSDVTPEDPNIRSVVEEMQRALGTKVRLMPKGKTAKGKIEIEYYSLTDLDRILQKITSSSAAV